MAEVVAGSLHGAAGGGGTKTGKLAIPVGSMAQTAQTRVIPKSQWPGPMLAKKNVFYRAGAVFERRDGKRILALYLLRRQQTVEPRLRLAGPCATWPCVNTSGRWRGHCARN